MKRMMLCLLLTLAVFALCACGMTVVAAYDHAESYTVGNGAVTQTIDSLDINWIDGQVILMYHDQDTVLISETSRRALNQPEQMRWLAEDGTLRVQYGQSGVRIASGLQKTLTITLPRGTILRRAEINCISGDIDTKALCAETIRLSNVSGAVKMSGAADQIRISTVSGAIQVETAANHVEVNATSGRIQVTMEDGKTLRAQSVSGDVSLQIGGIDAASVSTTSGRVAVSPYHGSGYTAQVETVSGTVSLGAGMQQSGKQYIANQGKTQVEIHTISGGVALYAKEQ